MRLKTAKQIVYNANSEVAVKIALASERTVEAVQREAMNTVRKISKRRNRKNG